MSVGAGCWGVLQVGSQVPNHLVHESPTGGSFISSHYPSVPEGVNKTIFLPRYPKPDRWLEPDLTWMSSPWVPKAFLAKALEGSL